MENQEENEDDFAKMFYANISDYLRNVHRLEVKDVSQRGTGAYQLLVEFEEQVISIQVARDKTANKRGLSRIKERRRLINFVTGVLPLSAH